MMAINVRKQPGIGCFAGFYREIKRLEDLTTFFSQWKGVFWVGRRPGTQIHTFRYSTERPG